MLFNCMHKVGVHITNHITTCISKEICVWMQLNRSHAVYVVIVKTTVKMKKNHSQFLNGKRSDNIKYWMHYLFVVCYIEGREPEGLKLHFWWNGDVYIYQMKALNELFLRANVLSSMIVHIFIINNRNQYTILDQTMVIFVLALL